MAKSKNRRKNGKVPSRNATKMIRKDLSFRLKDLIVCCCVDRREIVGDRAEMTSRTVVYNRRLKKVVSIDKHQEYALKKERWKWNIHSGLICRGVDNISYLDAEENIFTKEQVLLSEMNEYVADRLSGVFSEHIENNALTMFWVASPYDMGDVPMQAVLAPLWKFNVLGNCLTKTEQEKGGVVVSCTSDTLGEFEHWWYKQGEHFEKLKKDVDVSLRFERTGIPMKKGELGKFRSELKGFGILPRATVKSFENWHYDSTITGVRCSVLNTALCSIPDCLRAILTVRGDKVNKLTFEKGRVKDESEDELFTLTAI